MNPNISNLTEIDYDMIEEWIDEGSCGCPGIGCERCKDLFPEIPETPSRSSPYIWSCPCNHHGYKYVVKVVTEILILNKK